LILKKGIAGSDWTTLSKESLQKGAGIATVTEKHSSQLCLHDDPVTKSHSSAVVNVCTNDREKLGVAELDVIVASISMPTVATESIKSNEPILKDQEQCDGLAHYHESVSTNTSPSTQMPAKTSSPVPTKCPIILAPNKCDKSQLSTPPLKHITSNMNRFLRKKRHSPDTVSNALSALNSSYDKAITATTLTTNNSVTRFLPFSTKNNR
jgi:hypothetical protein